MRKRHVLKSGDIFEAEAGFHGPEKTSFLVLGLADGALAYRILEIKTHGVEHEIFSEDLPAEYKILTRNIPVDKFVDFHLRKPDFVNNLGQVAMYLSDNLDNIRRARAVGAEVFNAVEQEGKLAKLCYAKGVVVDGKPGMLTAFPENAFFVLERDGAVTMSLNLDLGKLLRAERIVEYLSSDMVAKLEELGKRGLVPAEGTLVEGSSVKQKFLLPGDFPSFDAGYERFTGLVERLNEVYLPSIKLDKPAFTPYQL